MAIDFPNSPQVDDTFTVDAKTWTWTGSTWDLVVGPGPTGPQGPQGPTGPQGPQGPQGAGVPVAGATGQVLTKASNSNYDTQWSTLEQRTYIQTTQPTAAGPYQWWDTSNGNLTLWIEDGL